MANKLVFIFQRFGADGLSTLVPHGDDNYYDLRPNTSLAAEDLLPINSLFGLHPALPYLHQRYLEGDVAFIHACGLPGGTLSHFVDQAYMETGGFNPEVQGTAGWASRLIGELYGNSPDVLRGLSYSSGQPIAAQGNTPLVNIASYESLFIPGYLAMEAATQAAASLTGLPLDAGNLTAMRNSASLASRLKAGNISEIPVANGARYDGTMLGKRLYRIAQMLKFTREPAVILTENNPWDHHINMLPAIENNLADLDQMLEAFYTDIGSSGDEITVVIGTEFGRRAYENDSLGTDHGEGGLFMVIGKNVVGGLHGDWPGLAFEELTDTGSLAVANDYRDVMRSVISGVFGIQGSSAFPVATGHSFSIM